MLAKHKIQTRLVTESNQWYQRAGLHSRSISFNPLPKKSNFSTGVSMGYDMLDDDDWSLSLSSTSSSAPACPRGTPSIPKSEESEECFLPGFIRGPVDTRQDSEFVGTCPLCHRTSVLALLMRHSPDTSQCSKLGQLVIPLTEVFSSSICCDACASYLVPPSDLLDEPNVGAVALVSTVNKQQVAVAEGIENSL